MLGTRRGGGVGARQSGHSRQDERREAQLRESVVLSRSGVGTPTATKRRLRPRRVYRIRMEVDVMPNRARVWRSILTPAFQGILIRIGTSVVPQCRLSVAESGPTTGK